MKTNKVKKAAKAGKFGGWGAGAGSGRGRFAEQNSKPDLDVPDHLATG
jgi:hypothetical protein